MPKGPTKRRPETRARLLSAATEAFADLGFGGATIDEICRRAGYTTGAYYSNFASKEELFFALFEDNAEKAIERLDVKLAELDTPTVTAEQVAMIIGQFHDSERVWYLVSTEFTLFAIRNPEAARRLADYDRRIRDRLIPALESMFARMGRRSEADMDLLARLYVALREGGLLQSLVEPEELPAGTLERAFLPSLLEAISRPAED